MKFVSQPKTKRLNLVYPVSQDAVVYFNDSFVFAQEDCVKVTGFVEEEFVGINAFSATRTVPSISARTIDKVDCTQAINSAVKTVSLEKTQIKGGIKVVFHKVEFSDKNTRVYLTVENLNKKSVLNSMTLIQRSYKAKDTTLRLILMMLTILRLGPTYRLELKRKWSGSI